MTEKFDVVIIGAGNAGFGVSSIAHDADSDLIVGAHLVGHSGEELIHLFALAMVNGIPATQLREQVYAFSTFSADIKSML